MNPNQNDPVFLLRIWNAIKNNGVTDEMDGYEKRRLGIFNLINFFGFITGLLLPLIAFFNEGFLPLVAWIVAVSPAVISLGVLISNYFFRNRFALLWYFTLYPLVTSLVYVNSIDAGIELFFIFYAVLAVFFLQQIRYLVAAISFSLLCFIMVYVVKREYTFVMADINYSFFVLNHLLSLLFIFGGLFLIKKENIEYQNEILDSNEELNNYNLEIEQQKEELNELNNIKSKMFSIISHDLRLPIYGLRNLFKSIHENDLPADEIKVLLPEVVKDLNNTTELMENLLQWAKSQMKGELLTPDVLNMTDIVNGLFRALGVQAKNKNIQLQLKNSEVVYAFADKGMMETVIRNLISNAIKFTPPHGNISIHLQEVEEMIEVNITDNGIGMDEEVMNKLFGNDYFSTNGTSNETGTGLGLMICRDFVQKNGGEISVSSRPGAGTTFTFTVPKA
ncbi:MAG TPA: ATP-binding protein [Lacibacter sp.]|nr:ATP-binding protein [Lacibacter sp.]